MSIDTRPSTAYEQLQRIESSKLFQGAVIFIIILSALAIGAKTYDLPPLVMRTVMLLDSFITIFFVVEIGFRFVASPYKKRFFHD